MQAAGDFSAVGCVLVCGVCRLADAPDLELTFYTFLVVAPRPSSSPHPNLARLPLASYAPIAFRGRGGSGGAVGERDVAAAAVADLRLPHLHDLPHARRRYLQVPRLRPPFPRLTSHASTAFAIQICGGGSAGPARLVSTLRCAVLCPHGAMAGRDTHRAHACSAAGVTKAWKGTGDLPAAAAGVRAGSVWAPPGRRLSA
eukprot:3762272-Rhodomonas_salina.1